MMTCWLLPGSLTVVNCSSLYFWKAGTSSLIKFGVDEVKFLMSVLAVGQVRGPTCRAGEDGGLRSGWFLGKETCLRRHPRAERLVSSEFPPQRYHLTEIPKSGSWALETGDVPLLAEPPR